MSTTSSGFPLRGCTAIVTGASSGLGVQFARQLAPSAACLVLAARSAGPMEELAGQLRAGRAELRIIVCPCDLATDEGRARLWQTVEEAHIQPNLLINNAGLGDYGAFAEAEVGRIRQQIDVNITALTLLSHAFLNRVREGGIRPSGIINVSSLASALPIPSLAVYAASKVYVLYLSEALNVEGRGQDVHVLAVCPGPTPTNFSKTARREAGEDIDRRAQNLIVVPPERVVALALRGIERGKACVFPGKRVALVATLFRMIPRPLLRRLMGFIRRPQSVDGG